MFTFGLYYFLLIEHALIIIYNSLKMLQLAMCDQQQLTLSLPGVSHNFKVSRLFGLI
jgi:hypothetical protein